MEWDKPIIDARRIARLVAGVGMLAALAAGEATGREPPASGCLDLRTVDGAWLAAPREALLRTEVGAHARLRLSEDCPAPPAGESLGSLAPEGWLCPGGQAWLRSGERVCAVASLEPLDAAALADALRAADAATGVPTLDPVEVRGRAGRARGFAGTTEYCLDSRYLRGWHTDRDGLVVEVSPRRHAGNRYYRIETANACPQADAADQLRLVSGIGLTAICGHAGDRVELVRDRPAHVEIDVPTMFRSRLTTRGCEIRRVYPLPGSQTASAAPPT
ncbi:hypothetical protein [Luteimonas huabeiensis]|uniref:hypothetical protein n=1 Tax=Luteimonas huabeiensis TaxID=1244513 RepID=UPI0004B2966F|nr:hypothetical protein [Luteimonas huabeiensis]